MSKNRQYKNTQRPVSILLMIAWLWLLLPLTSTAQNSMDYDEVPVTVNLVRVGSVEVSAIIKQERAYLSLTELFDFLKIDNHPTAGFDSLRGTFINPQAAYLVDGKENKIFYKDRWIEMEPGALILSGANLYLRLDYLSRVFDLSCSFSFRSLSVLLTSSQELPVVREMRQSQMRSNIRLLKGNAKADTLVDRHPQFFSAGMADWSVLTRQYIKGSYEANMQLALGARLAGGETNVLLNYSNHEAFRERQQNYQWRWVNNEHAAVRQVVAGKFIASRSLRCLIR